MNSVTCAFIYDEIASDPKNERILAQVEGRLTSLDIQGRVARLALFRNAKALIENLIREGVSTVVIVGNDRSLEHVMSFLPEMPVTVGYLPIAQPTDIAQRLGIPLGVEACDVLAARLVEKVDVGKIQDQYFLTEITIFHTNASVEIDHRYRISSIHGGLIAIRNMNVVSTEDLSNAQDGLFEVVVAPDEAVKRERTDSSQTMMRIPFGEIVSMEPIDIQVDHQCVRGSRFRFEIIPGKLKLIMGRSRKLVPFERVLPNPAQITTLSASMSVKEN